MTWFQYKSMYLTDARGPKLQVRVIEKKQESPKDIVCTDDLRLLCTVSCSLCSKILIFGRPVRDHFRTHHPDTTDLLVAEELTSWHE